MAKPILLWVFLVCATTAQSQIVTSTPLFQFGIFYENDMETTLGTPLTFNGPVQCNGNIYLSPNGATLTFTSNVFSAGSIYTNEDPLNPEMIAPGTVVFDGMVQTNLFPMALRNDFGALSLLQLPTNGQTPNSRTGTNLLYNLADMIIVISNNNQISVTSGAGINNQATVISDTQYSSWLSTNGTFTDLRDNLTVNPIVINVSNLVQWSATNTTLSSALSSVRGSSQNNVQSIYIDDQRGTSNATVTTNYTYGTNYSTNQYTCTGGVSCFPASGTYAPPILSTNLVAETNSTYPRSGNYLGSITNLITTTTNATITTNTHTHPPTYTTNISYTYTTNYAYAFIDGYTYNAITAEPYTNTTYLTNWPVVYQPGIVLSNGAMLPPQGLSVVTPDPVYIVGNWNIETNRGGSNDIATNTTIYSYPSAVFADAVTILSPAWNPANSSNGISSRTATSDTVNASIFTGIVPSDGVNYSGGVENILRLLENWNGQTLWYNGSLAQMFYSQIADSPWPGTGTVYNPPTRSWAYDTNFSRPGLLPPLTPYLKPMATSPALQAALLNDGSVLLSWDTHPQAWYGLEYTCDLTQTNWQSLTSFTAMANCASYSDSPGDTQRFYRLQVVP